MMRLLNKLFGSGRVEKTPDLQEIIRSYGDALASGTSLERDVAELPYSKAIINDAIIEAIKLTTDATMKQQLSTAFVSLADFQVLSGKEKAALNGWNGALSDVNADPSAIQDAAKTIAESGEIMSALRQRILGEAEERNKRVSAGFGGMV